MENIISDEGIIYILTNPAMPGLVKIGMTLRDQVDSRLNELYTTGVPVPFDCEFAGKIYSVRKVEQAMHIAFGPYRINPRREFFEIDVQQAQAILELFCYEEVTPQVNDELDRDVDTASKEAGEKLRQRRRPRLNFTEMNIPVGAVLQSNINDDECTVISETKVRFREQIVSLTRATRLSLDNDYNVAPCPNWVYQGRNLGMIYDETYGEVVEE